MATFDAANLRPAVQNVVSVAENIPLWVAVPATLPLFSRVFANVGKNFSNLSEGEAVTVFALVGGISGGLSQWLASQNLKQVGRRVNVLELMPAILAIIVASALLTVLMLPPAPFGQAVREFLVAIGLA